MIKQIGVRLLAEVEPFLVSLLEVTRRALADQRDARRERVLQSARAQMRRDMHKAFLKQGRAFVRNFRQTRHLFQESVTPADWIPLLAAAQVATEDDFAEAMTEGLGQAVLAGARTTAAEFGLSLTLTLDNTVAAQFLEEHGARQVTRVNATTQSQIGTVIAQAVEEGVSWQETARRIAERFEDFAGPPLFPSRLFRTRAQAVAVFETRNAFEFGSFLQAQELAGAGLRMEKAWLTVGDDRVRDDHEKNEKQGFVPIGEDFQSGDSRPPTDPG